MAKKKSRTGSKRQSARSRSSRRRLTQTKAAALLGLKQPDVSALVTGPVGKFSIERLVRCLVRCLDRLDYKIDLVVRQKSRRAAAAYRGHISAILRGSVPCCELATSSLSASMCAI